MAKVRARGNRETELKLLSILRANQISGWRRHPQMRGTPDFAFRREKVAIFVDGCFWHGCRSHCRMPTANRLYWQQKIARNIVRDRAITKDLKRSGWKVVRFWSHQLRFPDRVAKRVISELSAGVKLQQCR